MISIQFALFISLFTTIIKADTLLGCYSSLPSSFKLINTYGFQTSSYCSGKCAGYDYFALTNHANCYCGNSQPDSSNSADTCNTYCYGYSQEMCGGESSFSVYSKGDQEQLDTTSSDSNSATQSHTSVSALDSQVNVQASSSSKTTSSTSSTSSTASAGVTTSPITSITSEDQEASTSVVFSTTFHTEGGSTIFVTNTITKSAIATATGRNGTTTNDNSNTSGSNKKKTNVGAIVGGVVGGVVGAIVIAIIALFGVRHYNMKKEEDRMEKEYQEAIKPVEYNPNNNIMADTLSISSHGSFDANNKEDGMFRSSGSTGNFNNIRNDNTPTDTTTAAAATTTTNNNIINNPFDDSKRISTGSVFTGQQLNNKTNVLTVVNPDQD